jgi:hypothetical protein
MGIKERADACPNGELTVRLGTRISGEQID